MTFRHTTVRQDVNTSIENTRAALARLTPEQQAQVREQVRADMAAWVEAFIAETHAKAKPHGYDPAIWQNYWRRI